MADKGSIRVEINGLNDKHKITAVFCGTIFGDFLPMQLMYCGKTRRCHPAFCFQEDWHITHSSNHGSNESTMLDYIHNIIVPYVENIRDRLGVSREKSALAIIDQFKSQITQAITQALEENKIHSVLVPATCTDRLQPLDLSINKSAKNFLRQAFEKWYGHEITRQLTTLDSND
ncbi:PREDICTED: uncharacterized protein LOC105316685 [Amphimedon queenslandica]|uniref:DDE-1 domain-containing protein n=1 Tax=Amphimedon queenslandica TaxID=400682 RepID=A0AAN0IU77_AMPQE|nr:PREDICTED: uncharacterized protein LOC105316685 [Amphimedon queenslandica]|eukprot:XP_011410069.1 PREDICTED: uncharacterized protein LOC105316685 [Amphimedon queenslandica]